jgi:hypothetical protein
MRAAMRAVVLMLGLGAFSCAARLASGPPLPVRDTGVHQGSPELTTKIIMDTILAKKAELGDCFQIEREESPYLSGKLLMVWDILPTGETANIGVVNKEDAALELSHCVARVLATYRFPPSDTGVTRLVFPFKY